MGTETTGRFRPHEYAPMPDDTRDTPASAPQTGPSGSPLHTALEDYGVIALVLQGGGALGSYQGGVVEGLMQAGVEPNWVAGISIGALNAAIIAGNPPERRVERLRAFWDAICAPQFLPPSWAVQWPEALVSRIDGWPRSLANAWDATRALLEGQPGFFRPRLPPLDVLLADGPAAASFYDTTPLRATLLEYADFERINTGPMLVGNIGSDERLSYTAIGDAVNVASRLCSLAREGQVIRSENTLTTVSDKVDYIALPPTRVKGKEQALRIYNVIGRKGDSSGFFSKELTKPG